MLDLAQGKNRIPVPLNLFNSCAKRSFRKPFKKYMVMFKFEWLEKAGSSKKTYIFCLSQC